MENQDSQFGPNQFNFDQTNSNLARDIFNVNQIKLVPILEKFYNYTSNNNFTNNKSSLAFSHDIHGSSDAPPSNALFHNQYNLNNSTNSDFGRPSNNHGNGEHELLEDATVDHRAQEIIQYAPHSQDEQVEYSKRINDYLQHNMNGGQDSMNEAQSQFTNNIEIDKMYNQNKGDFSDRGIQIYQAESEATAEMNNYHWTGHIQLWSE